MTSSTSYLRVHSCVLVDYWMSMVVGVQCQVDPVSTRQKTFTLGPHILLPLLFIYF
jgi:hypothetical protein